MDDGLLEANPFARVKLRLDDNSSAREVLTRQDLAALFDSVHDAEEWWLFRIGLYTGARLGEICPLTKADLVTLDGVPLFHIREDAEAGKRVKIAARCGRCRSIASSSQTACWSGSPGAKATLCSPWRARRKQASEPADARGGPGPDKPFHSLRHTFKTAARRVMGAEWHDRITGHAHRTVGETYGDYDLRTLKEKMDLIAFGIEG